MQIVIWFLEWEKRNKEREVKKESRKIGEGEKRLKWSEKDLEGYEIRYLISTCMNNFTFSYTFALRIKNEIS